MILELVENSLFALILVGVLFICTVALCTCYFRLLKIKPSEQTSDSSDQRPISVVIATRNEHDQLRQNLPFFLDQNYANFEVVVVIDDSDKDLVYIIDEFQKQYSNLKVVSFDWARNFFVSHKFAESVGIKSATYNRILLSHISTRPASPEWISQMSKSLSDHKKIVIGYHTLASKISLLNAFVRFDTFFYTLRYLRAAISGRPFTADSRNLAFDRLLLYDTKGIARFYNVNTGDENMFVNLAATNTNTAIEIHPNAFVKGQEATSFGEWFSKKIRHRVLIQEFKTFNRLGLATHNLFMALFYIVSFTILGCFFFPIEKAIFDIPLELLGIAGGIIFLKFLVQWIVFKRMMSTFKERGFLLLIPVFDLIKLAILPVLILIGLFTKRITWK